MSTLCPHCGAHHGFGAAQLEGHGTMKSDPNIQRIADLQRQLAEKTAEAKDLRAHYKWALEEIEAMRPVVDAARYHERSVTFYSHGTSSDPYHCDVCRAYKVYEARKQP